MNNKLLQQYAALKVQIKELTDRAKDMEPKVLKELQKENIETANTDFGTFSVVKRVKWEYSPKYKETEEKYGMILDAARKTEQEDGSAKKVESTGLMYRGPQE